MGKKRATSKNTGYVYVAACEGLVRILFTTRGLNASLKQWNKYRPGHTVLASKRSNTVREDHLRLTDLFCPWAVYDDHHHEFWYDLDAQQVEQLLLFFK